MRERRRREGEKARMRELEKQAVDLEKWPDPFTHRVIHPMETGETIAMPTRPTLSRRAVSPVGCES